MKRIVQAEWLDELPANDPMALASRRDLRRLHRIMGNQRIIHQLLRTVMKESVPRRIVEIGAGEGTFLLALARHFSRAWPQVELVLVDRKDAVTEETRRGFETLGWKIEIIVADVFDWLKKPSNPVADLMLANLFIHHFSETQLSQLLGLISEKTRCFVACEPRRAVLPLVFSRMVGVIGCNAVTRCDAPLSVQAGFTGRELSTLWRAAKTNGHWQFQEQAARLFSHVFLAQQI